MHCFTFSALGHDTQLFRVPMTDIDRFAIAEAENLPVPLTRWALERDAPPDASKAQADPALYGSEAGVIIEAVDWPTSRTPTPITADIVIPADLSDWSYKVPKGHVAVDPVLGRIVFPASQPPRLGVKVSYHYGFACRSRRRRVRACGGAAAAAVRTPTGVAGRAARRHEDHHHRRRSGGVARTPVAACGRRRQRTTGWRRLPPHRGGGQARLVIELMSSGLYKGRFNLELGENETVAIVAAPGTRPVLWLSDESPGSADSITIRGGVAAASFSTVCS